jgi:hypothetical protein
MRGYQGVLLSSTVAYNAVAMTSIHEDDEAQIVIEHHRFAIDGMKTTK